MPQKKYFIKTFGCQQNKADSERIASELEARGMIPAKDIKHAEHIVINTCMVRESAENRVYGLVNNLAKLKSKNPKLKIVLTGCMVGMAVRDKSGKFLKSLKKKMPDVDEFLPIEEVGFDNAPLRTDDKHAWVPISNGCNNFCTFCVVPFTRGREISRPFEEILEEVNNLAVCGYESITLLGMNVNSYGADLIVGKENVQVLRDIEKTYFPNQENPKREKRISSNSGGIEDKNGFKLPNGKIVRPVRVNHLGRSRIPTLFPYLLEEVCKVKGIRKVDFVSSNPWDFSDELIDVIYENKNISREIHLPVQSGSNSVLRRMNRWYTREQYIELVEKIKRKIPEVKISTDIIVGFCGETEEEFMQTVDLCKRLAFNKAYIARYSNRPLTAANKVFKDDVPHKEKKRRWQILENLINK